MILHELITYLHLIGFALGFGGAMVSDAMFFSTIKDKKISETEFRFMQLGGRLVWIGLALLLLSGVGLVVLKPALLSSSKFLIKMVIVCVIAVNGVIFHHLHLPHMRHHINILFHRSEAFMRRSVLLTMSGGVSVISWFSAALLGSLPGLPFSFLQLLGVYLLLLMCALLGGVGMNYVLFRLK